MSVEVELIAEETGTNLNVVESDHDRQAQGKPRWISAFMVSFFCHKYCQRHVMCIRCEDLDDILVAFLVAS
jgi:hypothetical protein